MNGARNYKCETICPSMAYLSHGQALQREAMTTCAGTIGAQPVSILRNWVRRRRSRNNLRHVFNFTIET